MNKEELICNLVKVLEQMEDDLVFTVFYSFAEFQESHYFTPAWDFRGYYYEIQYDYLDELEVLRWQRMSANDVEGDILTEEKITQLTKDLVENWAEKELKKEENIKQMIES